MGAPVCRSRHPVSLKHWGQKICVAIGSLSLVEFLFLTSRYSREHSRWLILLRRRTSEPRDCCTTHKLHPSSLVSHLRELTDARFSPGGRAAISRGSCGAEVREPAVFPHIGAQATHVYILSYSTLLLTCLLAKLIDN